MVTLAPPLNEVDRVEAFKERTKSKLRDVVCPVHRQSPRLQFRGTTMRDITISMSGCCNGLLQIANKAIAS